MDKLEIERIKVVKRDYPKWTKVVLIRMDDEQAPMRGTEGTVEFVDDRNGAYLLGQRLISWSRNWRRRYKKGIRAYR